MGINTVYKQRGVIKTKEEIDRVLSDRSYTKNTITGELKMKTKKLQLTNLKKFTNKKYTVNYVMQNKKHSIITDGRFLAVIDKELTSESETEYLTFNISKYLDRNENIIESNSEILLSMIIDNIQNAITNKNETFSIYSNEFNTDDFKYLIAFLKHLKAQLEKIGKSDMLFTFSKISETPNLRLISQDKSIMIDMFSKVV